MLKPIIYTTKQPESFKQLLKLYEALGWNSLNLSEIDLEKMCKQSWYAIYAFDEDKMVGMGRVISDGVITGIICGVCVLPAYQSKGIGKAIVDQLVQHCEENRVIPQLMCVEGLEPYYVSMGFRKFSIGMTRNITH
ncbi:GNAT family N-acetyltransferase [Bacillus sp. APMAM]|nr:GNAT family N-acetyltransferase [Bacillus sp. APMAM]RTZ56868.1 GNAT family N-acetyltransferase [Bacillus sp. SAJ1]